MTAYGHEMAGLFGYSHMTGGYAGGQAEYVRRAVQRRRTRCSFKMAIEDDKFCPYRHSPHGLDGGENAEGSSARHHRGVGLAAGRRAVACRRLS